MKKSLQKCLIGLFAMGLCLSFSAKGTELQKAAAFRENPILEGDGLGPNGKGGSNEIGTPRIELVQLQIAYDGMSSVARANVTFDEFCNYYYSHNMTIAEVAAYFENLYGFVSIEPEIGDLGGMLKPDVPILQFIRIRNAYERLNPNAKANVSFAQFTSYYSHSGMTLDELVDYFNNLYPYVDPDDIPNNPYNDTSSYWWRNWEDVDGIISNNSGWGTAAKAAGTGFYPLPAYTNNEMNKVYNQSHAVEFNVDPEHQWHNPRIPNYDLEYIEVDYSELQPGDIVWDSLDDGDMNPNNWISHVAMIVNVNQQGKYTHSANNVETFTFVETIESVASGVRYGFLDDERIAFKGVKVYRPRATAAQRALAVQFMYDQLNKPYGVLENVLSSNGDYWYCTQLVYNAYTHAGFDLIHNANITIDPDDAFRGGLFVSEALCNRFSSDELMFYEFEENEVPLIMSVSNNGWYWSINVKNPHSFPIMLSYSPSLYFFGDIVQNFTDDGKSLGCIHLRAYQERTITIDTNWAAGTALLYFAFNGVYHVAVINNEWQFLGLTSFSYYYALKHMSRPDYQIGKTSEGDYKVQISINNPWDQMKFKFPNSPLMKQNEGRLNNFNRTVYTENTVTVNPYDLTDSDFRGTRILSVDNTYNSSSNYNSFCLRTYFEGTWEDYSISFSLDKSKNTYQRYLEYNFDYLRISMEGLYDNQWLVLRIDNLSNYAFPFVYCTETIEIYTNLHLENVGYHLATMQISAYGSINISVHVRSGYNDVVLWRYGPDYEYLASFGCEFNANTNSILLEMRNIYEN